MSGFPNNSTQGCPSQPPHFPLPCGASDDSPPVDLSQWSDWFLYNYNLPHYLLMDLDSDDTQDCSTSHSSVDDFGSTGDTFGSRWAAGPDFSQGGEPPALPGTAHDLLNTAFSALSGDGSAWAGANAATGSDAMQAIDHPQGQALEAAPGPGITLAAPDASDASPIALMGCTQQHHAAPHGGYHQ